MTGAGAGFPVGRGITSCRIPCLAPDYNSFFNILLANLMYRNFSSNMAETELRTAARSERTRVCD